MKILRYGLIVLVVGFVFGVALAQAQDDSNLDTDVNVCTQEIYSALQAYLLEQINLFGDIQVNNPDDVIREINLTIAGLYHYCSHPFTSKNNPTGIIGPLVFDGELYRVTFATNAETDSAYSTLSIVTIEDTCGYLSASIFGTDMVVELFEVNPSFDTDSNCTIMVEVDSDSYWELSFAKLK